MLSIPRNGLNLSLMLLFAICLSNAITVWANEADQERSVTLDAMSAQSILPSEQVSHAATHDQFLKDQEVTNMNMSPEIIETVKVEAQLPLEQQTEHQQKLAQIQHQNFKKTSLEKQAVTDYEVIRKLENEKNVSLPRYADAPQQSFRPVYMYYGEQNNITIKLEPRRSLNLRQ